MISDDLAAEIAGLHYDNLAIRHFANRHTDAMQRRLAEIYADDPGITYRDIGSAMGVTRQRALQQIRQGEKKSSVAKDEKREQED